MNVSDAQSPLIQVVPFAHVLVIPGHCDVTGCANGGAGGEANRGGGQEIRHGWRSPSEEEIPGELPL